ncbi:group IID secretory phospholipase A2-like [Sphaerodactylus townsendi]|uniref:group IID secretory phospholipase A2-like n=1 Tax=Sphaerodactylus townsendi TaxID=933632 RepID=UPI0020270A36|nr:group IID secretory phospholipase A2-like [Sphaerodactylus townsendi]
MEKMTLSALVTLLLIFGAVITEGHLFNLQKMIKQVTGERAIPNYFAYGCYCGWGGKGKPLDDTDWCCRKHDCCYDQIVRQRCRPKTSKYSYTYQSGNVKCGHGTSCQQQICECDRDLVLCLKKHLGSYRKDFRFHWNIDCRGSTPGC